MVWSTCAAESTILIAFVVLFVVAYKNRKLLLKKVMAVNRFLMNIHDFLIMIFVKL